MEELKKNLSALLDSTYELEGLLYLALEREEVQTHLLQLISEKSRELAERCEKLGVAAKDEETTDAPEIVEEMLTYVAEQDDDEVNEEDPESVIDLEKEPLTAETPAFSINDKFLFTRELFGGEKSVFDESLKAVAAMDSFEEAEQYFYDDLELYADSDVTQRFMEIIKEYFENR